MVLTVWTTVIMLGDGWVVATLAALLACTLGMLCFTGCAVFKMSHRDIRIYVDVDPVPPVEVTTTPVQGVAAVFGPLVVVGRPVEISTLRAAGRA